MGAIFEKKNEEEKKHKTGQSMKTAETTIDSVGHRKPTRQMDNTHLLTAQTGPDALLRSSWPVQSGALYR